MRTQEHREESTLAIGAALATFALVVAVGVVALLLLARVGVEKAALEVLAYAVLGVAALLSVLGLVLRRER